MKEKNKTKEIYDICKKIQSNFTTNNVQEILMQSTNEQIKNIDIRYISAHLCRLAKEKKISLVSGGKGGGRGNSNIYSTNKEK